MTCKECHREITRDEVAVEYWYLEDHWFICDICDQFED